MSLIPTIYSSTDPGAPQLSGTVGALLSVLRAVLVTGYGTAPNDKPGLGWTEEFTGANKAVFRNNPVTGTGWRLRVDDTNSQYCLVRGYASMTSVDAGVEEMPTVGQAATGISWVKSSLINATGRAWWVIGTERALYLFIDSSGVGIGSPTPHFVGDITSLKPADMHNFAISNTRSATYSAGASTNFLGGGSGLGSDPSVLALTAPMVVARDYTGTGAAQMMAHLSVLGGGPGGSAYGRGTPVVPYPSPATGGLLFDTITLTDKAGSIRGFMPGIYAPIHDRPLADMGTLTLPDGLPDDSVLMAKTMRTGTVANANAEGQVLFELAREW